MRLPSDHLFSIPVTLPAKLGDALTLDRDFALCNAKNELLAVLTVDEIYPWDRHKLACQVFGTTDACDPLA
jgi:sulfate adenylyltransferase